MSRACGNLPQAKQGVVIGLMVNAAQAGVGSACLSLTTSFGLGAFMAGLQDKPRDKREQERALAALDAINNDNWVSLGDAANAIVRRVAEGRNAS